MPIEDRYFYVIVDGRRINIMTTEGADAFINDGLCLYLSSIIALRITQARADLAEDSFRNQAQR
jgi:hypothetical protein